MASRLLTVNWLYQNSVYKYFVDKEYNNTTYLGIALLSLKFPNLDLLSLDNREVPFYMNVWSDLKSFIDGMSWCDI